MSSNSGGRARLHRLLKKSLHRVILSEGGASFAPPESKDPYLTHAVRTA
jgi:hypothetical protein